MSFHMKPAFGALLAALAACGHEHAPDDRDAADHHEEAKVHAGDQAPGDEGLVNIAYATTAPLARQGNVFHVTVTDPAGAPLTGATVALEFLAPAGGGPFSVTASAGVHAGMSGGVYLSESANFRTDGAWKLKVHVVRETDALHDHATFQLSVP